MSIFTTTVELVGLLNRGNPTLFRRLQKYLNMHIVLLIKRIRLLLKFSKIHFEVRNWDTICALS